MSLDSFTPWQAPLLALLVSLAWAAILRGRGVAGLSLGIGALAGAVLLAGWSFASPRQIIERVPALLAGGLVLAAPTALLRPRWVAATAGTLAALAGGWWLGGAPTWAPDAARAVPVMLGAALAIALLLGETAGAWRGVLAALLLAGLVALAAPAGPWLAFALVVLAAAAGALAAGPALAFAARLPLALGLAAAMLGPILARGAPGDWLAALGPMAALLLGGRLAGRGGMLLPTIALAVVALGLGWLLRQA